MLRVRNWDVSVTYIHVLDCDCDLRYSQGERGPRQHGEHAPCTLPKNDTIIQYASDKTEHFAFITQIKSTLHIKIKSAKTVLKYSISCNI